MTADINNAQYILEISAKHAIYMHQVCTKYLEQSILFGNKIATADLHKSQEYFLSNFDLGHINYVLHIILTWSNKN